MKDRYFLARGGFCGSSWSAGSFGNIFGMLDSTSQGYFVCAKLCWIILAKNTFEDQKPDLCPVNASSSFVIFKIS